MYGPWVRVTRDVYHGSNKMNIPLLWEYKDIVVAQCSFVYLSRSFNVIQDDSVICWLGYSTLRLNRVLLEYCRSGA